MNGTNQPNDTDRTPDDLLNVQGSIGRLAEFDRRAAKPGLEGRLFDASIGAFKASNHAPAPIRFPGAGGWRLAASITVLAGTGLLGSLWLMRQPSTSIVAPITSPAPIAQAEPTQTEPLDADELRGELEDFLASYDAVEKADLADSTPMSPTFWDSEDALGREDPIR